MPYALAPTTALIALHLHLLNHARGKLVSDNSDTVSTTDIAGIDMLIRRPCTLALLANLLLVPLELGRAAVVEVAEGDADFQLDVGTPALAGLVAEVAAAAEEAGEEVERIVVLLAALLALLEAFVTVLVVDFAGFGVDEGFVGFGDFDELVVGC